MRSPYHAVFSLKQSSEDLLWYWEQESRQQTNLCCEKLCTNTDISGTIVFGPGAKKQYVIPLCTAHACSDLKLYIPETFSLVEI